MYLDLSNTHTALELGSGCGALTRYLGEQGLALDAVEGSQRRANLAKIRCQGLRNVNVISSNFFDLSLPANHYDAIFFVGVMEYAGRFSPTDTSAEASVIRLLEKVRPCLTTQGIIVIAMSATFSFGEIAAFIVAAEIGAAGDAARAMTLYLAGNGIGATSSAGIMLGMAILGYAVYIQKNFHPIIAVILIVTGLFGTGMALYDYGSPLMPIGFIGMTIGIVSIGVSTLRSSD